MKRLLRLHKMFKEDYLAARCAVEEPARLTAELKTIAAILQQAQNLPSRYVSNALFVEGVGWHECYVYVDKKTMIIMQYKIEEHCVTFTRIGTPASFGKKQKIFAK
ncbi:MAG: hypothetical protein Q7T18_05850 [Sedimentisphaerales bacterium]|nr:hypothetical protein [Sedimentisphaerales bacterium]